MKSLFGSKKPKSTESAGNPTTAGKDVPAAPPKKGQVDSKDKLSSKSDNRGSLTTKNEQNSLGTKSEYRSSPGTKKGESTSSPPGRSVPQMRSSTGTGIKSASTQSNTGAKPNRARSTSSTGVDVRPKVTTTGKAAGPRRIKRPVSKKSNFEEGLQVIDELLKLGSDTYKAMTAKQRKTLANVKNLLLGRDTSNSTDSNTGKKKKGTLMSHIPRDLILEQRKERKRQARARKKVLPKNAPRMIQKKPHPKTLMKNSSCFFILEEYAGIKTTEEDDLDEEDEENTDGDGVSGKKPDAPTEKLSTGNTTINKGLPDSAQQPPAKHSVNEDAEQYVPQEFKTLSPQDQQKLCDLLTWESLSSWDKFDIFVLNDVTKGNPLIFMGWAVLGSPYAQSAMKFHLSGKKEDKEHGPGYTFMDDLKIPPHKLCNYLRVIQQDYHLDNPYHNAIHATDVVQSLHSMIQMALSETNNGSSNHLISSCPKLQLFAILLAAVVHDVDHPGKNNAYQTKVKSELAILYNDMSVLENWHAACAFARMLDLNLLQDNIQSSQGVQAVSTSPNKDSECNLLSMTSEEEFDTIRRLVIEAVLHTDMTKHFAMVDSAKGLAMQIKTASADGDDNENDESIGWNALMYMFHMSDISNQAKAGHLARLWTDRCMSEFFAQGQQEATLGIPISPLCDEATTSLPESQVGFIKFVVQPAYAVLGDLIGPTAQEQVVPHVQANLDHWTKEQQLQEGPDCEEAVSTSDDDDDLSSVDG